MQIGTPVNAVEPTSAPTSASTPWLSAARLAGLYFIVASLYIAVSSQIASTRAVSVGDLHRIELLKGLAFVTLTAAILFALNLAQLRRLRAHLDERVRRDRILHNAERSILAGTFARSVAHDVNNALMVAMLSLAELRDLVKDQAEATSLARVVDEALAEIRDWNQRLFTLGEGSRLFGDPGPFDLARTLRQSAQLARRHDHAREARIELDTPERAPFHGREALVQRAVLNLVLNAAEAGGAGCEIRIGLDTTPDGAYRLTVADDGPGIPADQRPRVLEPFFTTKEHGTGLGLASVAACASLHDGRVEIDESPRGGARFTLLLPNALA